MTSEHILLCPREGPCGYDGIVSFIRCVFVADIHECHGCVYICCALFFLAVFTMFVNLLVDFQVLLPEVICQYSGGDLQLWWQSMPQFISLAFPQRRPLISSTRASRLALFDVEWHVLNAPKGVPLALSLHFMRRGNHRSEAEVLISSHQTAWLGNKIVPHGISGPCEGATEATRRSTARPHIVFTWAKRKTHNLCAHIRSITRLDTHTWMQIHTWMIILGLLGHHWNFSAVTSLRGREGARWALEGAKMKELFNFNRMLPGENSHHLCVSSMPESHSLPSEREDPDCADILSEEARLPTLTF